jgi:hypothetical protein
MEVRVMKKYNTPEMNVSMFNCETVATSETASQYIERVQNTATVSIYSFEEIKQGISVGF